MRKVAVILYVVIFLTGFNVIKGIAAQPLTWTECVQQAQKNNPDLISAEERLNHAKSAQAVTKSNFFPQITGSAGTQRSKAEDFNRQSSYSYGLNGRQLLFDGLKTNSDTAAAGENVKNAQYNYEVTSSNVRLKLRTAFVNLLKAQDLITITREIAARRKQNVDLVTLRYQAGREHKGALMTAEADLSEAEFEAAQAKRNLVFAQRQLLKEMGQLAFAPLQVTGDFQVHISTLENPDFDKLSLDNPLLQSLIAQKDAARYGLKSAQANYFPQVYASGSVSRSATNWPPDHDQWSASINLSVPIFSGGSQVASANRAKAAYNQAQAEERSGRDEVLLTLAQAWNNMQDAIERVAVQRKFLEAAQERAIIAESQYSIGLLTFDNWIIIEDDLINTKKAYLSIQANALLAEAVWIQAKGGTLDD